MPKSRKLQISLDATPSYHCVSRCVRSAFLCGNDPITDRSFEHRRHQIEHDPLRLASIFYIDMAAFAALSNHYILCCTLIPMPPKNLELADWTGRIIREDKRGAISETASPILQRLNISTNHWLDISAKFEEKFKGLASSSESINSLCTHFGFSRQANRSNGEVLYGYKQSESYILSVIPFGL